MSALFESPAARQLLSPCGVHLALVVFCFAAAGFCFDGFSDEMCPGVISLGVAGR